MKNLNLNGPKSLVQEKKQVILIDMKITKEFILLVVIACLMVYGIITINNIKTDVNHYEHKMDSIQTNIDSINTLNSVINNNIERLNGDISNITIEIENVDKKINIIRQNTDEKINSVDTFGVNQLELFFTNRYGK
jgi:peptidoglycan hydrolase CwlO-like protein